uniref:Ovule protein n=1 Tax=Caenorhabditis tropicalis TaxID=1561998 RepID=A0A1I7TRD9_9PELO
MDPFKPLLCSSIHPVTPFPCFSLRTIIVNCDSTVKKEGNVIRYLSSTSSKVCRIVTILLSAARETTVHFYGRCFN